MKTELEKLIKADYPRKLVLANRAGFATIEAYKAHLQGKAPIVQPIKVEVKVQPIVKEKNKKKKTIVNFSTTAKKIIHYIDVLDRSGSMSGKIKAAAAGMAKAFLQLKNTDEIEYVYSLINCDTRVQVIYNRVSLKEVNIDELNNDHTGGGTPLYASIITGISFAKAGESSCINTYTDGGDTDRQGPAKCIKAIKEFAAAGNTVTFACTKQDANIIRENLGIDDSNILTHDNTSKGFEGVMQSTEFARSNYASKVAKGMDTTLGFYKKVGTL